MEFKKFVPALAVIALSTVMTTVAMWGTGVAQARQGNQPAVQTFGSVNLQKVLAESKGNKADTDNLRKMVETLDKVLQTLAQGPARFLPEAEIRELAALYEKAMPTDAEKKRIADLEDKASSRANDKRRLENTPNATAEERKRLADLTGAEEKGVATLRALQADYTKKLEGLDEDLSKKMEADVRTAVAKVAKERGITVIFNNPQVAVYTASDITDDVIKALNK